LFLVYQLLAIPTMSLKYQKSRTLADSTGLTMEAFGHHGRCRNQSKKNKKSYLEALAKLLLS